MLTVAASSAEYVSDLARQAGRGVSAAGGLNSALVATVTACCIIRIIDISVIDHYFYTRSKNY